MEYKESTLSFGEKHQPRDDGSDNVSTRSSPAHTHLLVGSGDHYAHDPFAVQAANKSDDYVEFRSMGWFQAGSLATAENVAISMLSYPTVFYQLGMVGGVIATVGLGIMAYFSAWVMVDFKIRHMGVMNYPDIGDIIFGKWGRRIVAVGLTAKSIGVAASHCIVAETAFKTITRAPICGIWWALIYAIISILISPTREWGKLSNFSYLSLACIITAMVMTISSVATQDPSVLEQGGPPIVWEAAPTEPTLVSIIGALTNIIFSFAGCTAAMSFASEMRKPNDFKKSFAMVQGVGIFGYIISGAVLYYYGGQYVSSPAINMASGTKSTAAYAISLVTMFISGVFIINVGAKYIYISQLRNSPLLTSKGLRARGIWCGIVASLWICGFIISQLIPFLNQLLTVIAALFAVWFSFGLVGAQWLYDNHPRWAAPGEVRRIDTPAKWAWFGFSIFCILLSFAILPLGIYSAVEGIITGYRTSAFTRPFAC